MKILFPKNIGQRYYQLHFDHTLNILRTSGAEITLFDDDTGERGCFRMDVNGVKFMVDFSDYGSEYNGPMPTLRFHHKRADPTILVDQAQPIFPFPQCSFWDWSQYEAFAACTTYSAEGVVMHNQRPANNSTDRRMRVRRIVEAWANEGQTIRPQGLCFLSKPLNGADTQYYGCPTTYWKSLSNCLVSVHVPGQNNNMLDTAQIQLMAFGFATISPNLPEFLPFWKTLNPGEHYVRCADDYSDLIEKIEWCRGHKAELLDIGKNAKKLFTETCTPAALKKWLEIVVGQLK